MGLTSTIFGKEIYDLQLNDLEIFFQAGQEENAVLEFKTGDISLENIYKEVAAFLNTDGGLLVIGAPRETPVPEDKKKKICKGALTPSSSITTQDTLFRNIASNISPAPLHIKAKSFSASEGHVYVLEIPQSLIPPHQVSGSGVYYIRLEREAKPAPHGLVEALFQKKTTTGLKR